MKKTLNSIADEIIEVLNGKNVKAVSNAVYLELIHQKRLSSINRLFELLEEKQSRNEGRLIATVSSPQSLTDEQIKSLKVKIEYKYKSKVDMKEKVDPKLLGGVQIKITDEITDYSYRGKINTLKTILGKG